MDLSASGSPEPIVDHGRDRRIADLLDRSLKAARATYDPERHLVYQPSTTRGGRTYRQAVSLPLAHGIEKS